jgi:Protein of unknown function (DUF3175)
MATKKKWSAKVNTESTYPEAGLFKKGARTIAKSLASPEVSPKGPASGMRMLNFYINRAGTNLPPARIKVLEHAKEILSGIIASQKEEKTAPQKSGKKAANRSAQQAASKSNDK